MNVPFSAGPTLLLATEGTIRVESADSELSLGGGQAAFGLPRANVRVSGEGAVWVSQLWTAR